MGEVFARCNGRELKAVTVTLPCCGVGLRFDLAQPLSNQFRGTECICGKEIPPIMKEIVQQYKKAYDSIHAGGYEVSFELKADR